MKKYLLICFLSFAISAPSFAQHKSGSWEAFKYAGPGLKQIGWLTIRASSEIKSSLWSVGCETLDRDFAKFSVYKDYVGALGVKSARLQSGWAKCELQPGKYSFAWLDSCVYGLSAQSVEPWMCLSYGNPLYGTGVTLGAKIFTDDKTMAAWLKYVSATVSRYKDVVKKWEVWNEPNGGNGSKAYGNLLIKTAEAIKKADPSAKVMGFSLAGIPIQFAREVFEILKENNKLDLIDYLTYHPYDKNPDDSYLAVAQLTSLKNEYNPKIRLYQGENGSPSQLEWTHALSNYPWTEISQAKWFMRRMAADRVRDIPSSIFTIIDLRYYNMLQSFGLIRSNLLHEIIYKRPSYYGVQHMTSFFDETVTAEGMLEYSSNAYRKLTVAGFKKDKRPVALLWYPDRVPDDALKWDPIQLTIKNINFKDPVYVEMVSGKVYEINKQDWENKEANVVFRHLPVWDCVMMLAERGQVKLKDEENG